MVSKSVHVKHHCLVERCIRRMRGDKSKDAVAFAIERNCPHPKIGDCPVEDRSGKD